MDDEYTRFDQLEDKMEILQRRIANLENTVDKLRTEKRDLKSRVYDLERQQEDEDAPDTTTWGLETDGSVQRRP